MSTTDNSCRIGRPAIEWVEVPTWTLPVWATLDGTTGLGDPLLEAIQALVEVGAHRESDIAARLAMPESLVQAAADQLVAQGILRRDDRGTLLPDPAKDRRPEDQIRTLPAWVTWDPLHDRPLLQVFLADRPPGRNLVEAMEADVYPHSPSQGRVDPALRLLALVSGLQVIEPRGATGAHLVDNARVRTLQTRGSGRARRASAWVAVEHRVTGSVVWRPSAARVEHDLGELDPAGWTGLKERCGERTDDIEAGRAAYQSQQVGPVLMAAGFDSVEALTLAAKRECDRELSGLGAGPAWSRTLGAIQQALIDQHLASAIEGDWRRLGRGWADAFEALTVDAVSIARQVIGGMERMPTMTPELEARLKRLTGPSWDLVRRCSKNERDFVSLRQRLEQDVDSTGHRLGALAIAAIKDNRLRAALLDADARVRREFPASEGLFTMLDTAREERNAISHMRTRAKDIDVAALKARVFVLARTLMGSGLGG